MNNTQETADSSVKGIASAIILQAVLDYDALRPSDTKTRQELDEFFASGWFSSLCELCGLEPHVIRHQLETGDYHIPSNNLRSQKR